MSIGYKVFNSHLCKIPKKLNEVVNNCNIREEIMSKNLKIKTSPLF